MKIKKLIQILLYALLVFLTILMLRITVPYFSLNDDIGFLRIKQWIIGNSIWKGAFFTHVFTSIILLIAGFTQFSSRIFKQYPGLHRKMGYTYIVTLLCFSAPSGFIMAIYANGGIVSQTAFLLLSVLWIFTTIQALRSARNKSWVKHGRFMIRSYALTLSALTLRVWKPTLAELLELPPMDLYRIVAWLGWVPNIIIAEILIKKGYAERLLQLRKPT